MGARRGLFAAAYLNRVILSLVAGWGVVGDRRALQFGMAVSAARLDGLHVLVRQLHRAGPSFGAATGIAWRVADAWCWCRLELPRRHVEAEAPSPAQWPGDSRQSVVRKRGLPLLRIIAFAWLLFGLSSLTEAQMRTGKPTYQQIDAVFAIRSSCVGLAWVCSDCAEEWRGEFQKGYGLANLETHTAIASDTDFRLASFTKQFTATCIMLLVHDGKAELRRYA